MSTLPGRGANLLPTLQKAWFILFFKTVTISLCPFSSTAFSSTSSPPSSTLSSLLLPMPNRR